jgi:WD40 repeat protein
VHYLCGTIIQQTENFPMPDIFISYGRKESKTLATRLHDRLLAEGYDVWFDQNDIPLAVDFQEQIDDGIKNTHNFVYIIAPHAIASPYCAKELQLAQKYSKRILPVMHVDSDYDEMPPIIQKLNWINAREKADLGKPQAEWEVIDDFEKAVAGLIKSVESQKEFVQQHTLFLQKALEWELNKKQTNYLLVGEERKRAENWLLTKDFYEYQPDDLHKELMKQVKVQPPCRPADLHAEFICESRKNAENLLCDVFISHAQTERELRNQIVRTLSQYNITCWSPQTDIKTGQDWDKSVEESIEQADNFVFFITPYTVKNAFFLRCLAQAHSYQKRIIPLLVLPTNYADFPDEIKKLTYIDITDNQHTDDLRDDLDNLLTELNKDSTYYYQHKVLLVQALKWKRQNQNASILLRGYNLQTAEDWLKLGKKRTQHKPHSFHEEYIGESIAKRGQLATEVFISYSRNDGDLARKLNNELQLYGKTTWFDQESIVEGVDFAEEIRKGIESADNFLFIISPKSVASPYCDVEVNHAVKLGKRIITVLAEALPISMQDTTKQPINLHPALAKVQWIDFKKDFSTGLGQVLRSLETDREYVQKHTKWGKLATEWHEKSKSEDLLLRGNEYALADEWLKKVNEAEAKGIKKQPQVTDLQREYIAASKKVLIEERLSKLNTIRRLRFLLGISAVGLLVAVASTIYAFRQRNDAHNKAVVAEINQLVSLARQVQADNPALALRIAERAYKKDSTASVRSVIRDILSDNIFYINLEGHENGILSVDGSPDNEQIATGSEDNTLRIWDKHGREQYNLRMHEKPVTSVEFSHDGNYLVSGSEDGTVKFWDREGVLFGNIDLGKDKSITTVHISPNNTQLLICTPFIQAETDTIWLYNTKGELLKKFQGHKGGTWKAIFSPSGKYILTCGLADSTAHLLDNQGNVIKKLVGHTGKILDIAFSPDENYILTAGQDFFAKLWDRHNGRELTTFRGHSATIFAVAFAPDNKTIATASADRSTKIWNLKGEMQTDFAINTKAVTAVTFSANGYYLITASDDGTASVIDLRGNGKQTFKENSLNIEGALFYPNTSPDLPNSNLLLSYAPTSGLHLWDSLGKVHNSLNRFETVACLKISPNKKMLLISDLHNIIKITDLQGNVLQNLEVPAQETSAISSVAFSPDSRFVAAANSEKTIRIWQVDGQGLKFIRLQEDDMLACIEFMPDGKTLLIGGLDNVIRLIDFEGKVLRQWKGHDERIIDLAVSPDGLHFISGSRDATVRLWAVNGGLTEVLKGHTSPITSVCFSHDGKKILTASTDNTARIWELNGQQTQIFRHDDVVNSAIFSDDNKTVLTISNNEAKFWYADWREFLSADRVAKFSLAEMAVAGVVVDFEEFSTQKEAKDLVDAAEYYAGDYESNEKLSEKTRFTYSKILFQKGLAILLDTTKTSLESQNTQLLSRAKIGFAEAQTKLGEQVTIQNFLQAKNAEEVTAYINFFAIKLEKAINKQDSMQQSTNLKAMYEVLIKKTETSEDLYKFAQQFENQSDDANNAESVMRNGEIAVKLYEKLYELDKEDNTKQAISKLCTSVAGYKLLDRNFIAAQQFAEKALFHDKNRLIAYTYLATSSLYLGQFSRAKQIYLQYKKSVYNGILLKEAFLNSIISLEAAGVVFPDAVRAKELLR